MSEDARTVGEILGVTDPAGTYEILPEREPTLQERVTAGLAFGPYGLEHPARILIETADPLDLVSAWAFERANRVVGPAPVWLRFRRADATNGLVAVIHSPTAPNEADLILVADRPGMLTRSVLRAICGWAFATCGLSRVVLRIPSGDARLKGLAYRAGCHPEAVARDFYGPGADASVWVMLARDCRWFGPGPLSATPAPPSRDRMH